MLLSFFDISSGFRFTKNQCEFLVHILRRPCVIRNNAVSVSLKFLSKSHSAHCVKTRMPQDMDRTLTLIFGKSETTTDITTKISAFLQL